MSGSSYQLPEPIDDTFLRSRWPLILSAGSGCPDLVLGLDWKILTKSFNSRVGECQMTGAVHAKATIGRR